MQSKRFQSTSAGSRRNLAVEESYKGDGQVYFGIAGMGVHLSADDAREVAKFVASLAGPAPKESAYAFEVGDRVEVGCWSERARVGTVVHRHTMTCGSRYYEVLPESGYRFGRGCAPYTNNGAGTTSEAAMKPAPKPEPVLEAGTRAAVKRLDGDTLTATRVEVLEVLEDGRVLVKDDGSNLRVFRFKGSRALEASSLRVMDERTKGLFPVFAGPLAYSTAPEDAGDVEGVKVWVTGDSDGWGHGFEKGTFVEIERYDETDGSYLVKPIKGEDRYALWVGSPDLAIESPLEQEIPNGTKVRILNNGRDGGLRHFLEIGSTGTITGWRDTSTQVDLQDQTYRVEVDGLTQSLHLDAFEVVTPEEEFPIGTRVKIGTGHPYFGLASEGVVVRREPGHRGSVMVKPDGYTVGLGFEVSEIAKVEEPLAEWERELLGYGEKVGAAASVPARYVLGADPKTFPAFEKGDKVRVTGNSEGNPAGPHSLEVGGIAEVVDGAPARHPETVYVSGPRRGYGHPLGQWVLRSDVTKVRPSCGFRDCALGCALV